MCQQWLSIIGVGADLVGFVLIAIEWHRSFTHAVFMRNRELQDAFERNLARERGRQSDFTVQDEDETMAREFSKLHNAEALFKKKLFWTGVTLVALGFILQALGAWPYADPILGLTSC